jgi:hypothetical protein
MIGNWELITCCAAGKEENILVTDHREMMHGGVKTLRITHTFLLGKIFEFTICQTT